MAKRIFRTTQERTVDTSGRPIETVKEREVVRTLKEPEGVKVYEPGTALPERIRTEEITVSEASQLAEVATRVRAQESWARTQSGVLRDIDHRLTRLEDTSRGYAVMQSIEQTTWWALWGILMLIVGSALAVVIILIVTSAAH